MKLVQIVEGGKVKVAERGDDSRVRVLAERPLAELLLEGWAPQNAGATEWRELAAGEQITAPVHPRQILAVGANYPLHIEEAGMEPPEHPIIFPKLLNTVIGPGDEIVVDRRVCRRADWEVELAVVIGARLTNASLEEARQAVFGYTVANDVSARDVQQAEAQWTRAKGFDTFCPLGPVIVTADDIEDPSGLRLATRVNGETVQDAPTSAMLLDPFELIAHCSKAITLMPGDMVLTGTPWGCGEFMDPKRSLQDGDRLESEASSIGVLENVVRVVG